MMTRKASGLVLVVLALGLQALASVHAPWLHDEPVSACAEGARHFCAEETPADAGPCLLCQISAGGIVSDEGGTAVAVLETDPVVLLPGAPAPVCLRHSPESPRAPPVG